METPDRNLSTTQQNIINRGTIIRVISELSFNRDIENIKVLNGDFLKSLRNLPAPNSSQDALDRWSFALDTFTSYI